MNITPAIRARLVRRLRAGATIADAARRFACRPTWSATPSPLALAGTCSSPPSLSPTRPAWKRTAAGSSRSSREPLVCSSPAPRSADRQAAQVPHGCCCPSFGALAAGGGAPEPHLKPIADAVSARTRPAGGAAEVQGVRRAAEDDAARAESCVDGPSQRTWRRSRAASRRGPAADGATRPGSGSSVAVAAGQASAARRHGRSGVREALGRLGRAREGGELRPLPATGRRLHGAAHVALGNVRGRGGPGPSSMVTSAALQLGRRGGRSTTGLESAARVC